MLSYNLHHVGVLVLAATNRPRAVDPALLRPGRFDVHIKVPLPNAEERQDIIKIHSCQFSLNGDVDLVVSFLTFQQSLQSLVGARGQVFDL